MLHSPSFRRLQGKTQLIPSGENEFFRTRLTHSLEVADIAVRIAKRINSAYEYFQSNPIDLDVVATACLAHDIGHPPFGHSGEMALNMEMDGYGGFEGNAQTLRLLTKIEGRLSRQDLLDDARCGLNLTYRTIASILKYDQSIDDTPIPEVGIRKGYYGVEQEVVADVKKQLLGSDSAAKLYSLECQIMDLADDIAYSTYDMEDAFAANLISPFDLCAAEDFVIDTVHTKVAAKSWLSGSSISYKDVSVILASVFKYIFKYEDSYDMRRMSHKIVFAGRCYNEGKQHANDPLLRRISMETMIEESIRSVEVKIDEQEPMMSKVVMNPERRLIIQCLKEFIYTKVIDSGRLQISSHNGREVVSTLFKILLDDRIGKLIPENYRPYYERLICSNPSDGSRARIVCDIVALMTDGEAYSLYRKLRSFNRETIFSF